MMVPFRLRLRIVAVVFGGTGESSGAFARPALSGDWMANALAWLAFYPKDWRCDPHLATCSLSARGLWIGLLAVMHECEAYGVLSLSGGAPLVFDREALTEYFLSRSKAPPDGELGLATGELSRIVGADHHATASALGELVYKGVASLTSSGAIVSRRMVRDAKRRRAQTLASRRNGALGARFGKLGGRPPKTPGGVSEITPGGVSSRETPRKPLETPRNPPGGYAPTAEPASLLRLTRTIFDPITPKTPDIETKEREESSLRSLSNARARLAESFARFWLVYPRKIAKAKALSAWVRIAPDPELVEKIVAAVELAKRSRPWTKENGEFIPYPASWLNQARWNDEIEPTNGGPEPDTSSPAASGCRLCRALDVPLNDGDICASCWPDIVQRRQSAHLSTKDWKPSPSSARAHGRAPAAQNEAMEIRE